MLNFSLCRLRIEFTQSINSFLFAAKSLPILKKLISDKIYRRVSMKNAFGVIGIIFKCFDKIFRCAASALLAAYMPIWLTGADAELPSLSYYLTAFLLINGVAGGIFAARVLVPSRDKYIGIKLMRMNAKKYELFDIFVQNGITALCYFPFMTILGLLTGSISAGVLMPIAWYMLRLIFSALSLMYYRRIGKLRHSLVDIIAAVLCVGGVIAILMTAGVAYNCIPVLTLIPLGLLPLAVLSALYLIRFDGYADADCKSNAREMIVADEEDLVALRSAGMEIDAKTLEKSSSIAPGSLSPHAYLTKLFYIRNRRVLQRIPLIVICGAAVAAVAVAIAELSGLEVCALAADNLSRLLPMTMLATYILSSGKKFTRLLFYHCDMSMLHYPFYRNTDSIVKNFLLRACLLSVLNLVPALVCGGVLCVCCIIGGADAMLALAIPAAAAMLSALFSVFHLALYYIFQPYTTMLVEKSAGYTITGSVFYFLVFMLSSFLASAAVDAGIFLLAVASALMLVCIAAFLFVRWLSPKRFRVR